MNYQQLLEQIKSFVIKYFKANGQPDLIYHNLEHTESVVERAGQIARHYQFGEREMFVVQAAAWFHDTGYLTGGAVGHEVRGAEIATAFLTERGAEEPLIQSIRDCILATRMPQSPQTLMEQIVSDADLFHFGTQDFWTRNKLMRKEAEMRLGKKISKDEWRKGTIRFLEAHTFHTDYSRQVLNQAKYEHLRELRKKDVEGDASDAPRSMSGSPNTAKAANPKPDEPAGKKAKSDRPERGIETMFRITSGNNQRLSDMADNKAHIMITTTSIIISVLLSVLLRKLEDNPQLIIPTMILLTVCVVTMVFSILATRPSLPHGTFTEQDLSERRVNLLFFGNFYRMSFDDYDNGMKQLMNERDFLYGTLTRDVYSQGVVLGKKYRLLRNGYNVFMYGIVASVIAFFLASLFFK